MFFESNSPSTKGDEMDLTGSFPILTDEQYEESLRDFHIWRGAWPTEIFKGGPSEIFILTKNDRVRWNDGTGSVKFGEVQRPDKALMSALVALVTKRWNVSEVVVLIKRLQGETHGVVVPLWWETGHPNAS